MKNAFLFFGINTIGCSACVYRFVSKGDPAAAAIATLTGLSAILYAMIVARRK